LTERSNGQPKSIVHRSTSHVASGLGRRVDTVVFTD
jgi:hypothetical protein